MFLLQSGSEEFIHTSHNDQYQALFNLKAVVCKSGRLGGMFLTSRNGVGRAMFSSTIFAPKVWDFLGLNLLYGLGPHIDLTQELPTSIWEQTFPTLQEAQHREAWNA